MSINLNEVNVACVQLNAGGDVAGNLAVAGGFVRQAASQGTKLIVLPEKVDFLANQDGLSEAHVAAESENVSLPFFSALAKECGVWIVAGSLGIQVGEEKIANRSYVFSPNGEIAAHYDKIHLFDVDLGNGEKYQESAKYKPGEKLVTVSTPWGDLGLTICYDVRFPYLYRALAKAGVKIITVPAAFTVPTGEAHWHILLRARAIETGAFILAPAQCGEHPGGRRTYGHSLIINPWGEILAEAANEPGIIMAKLNLQSVSDARQKIPSLRHDRDLSGLMKD